MDGYSTRVPEVADAEAIAEHVRSYTRDILGYADYTLADARDELTDPETECRLVVDGSGRVAGFASYYREGDRAGIDIVAPAEPVARELLTWLLDRAGTADHVDHGVYRADTALRNLLSEHGFRVATTFHRMRVDHDGPVAFPPPPPGVALRTATDPEVRPLAHAVLTESFADHFAFTAKPYQEWHDSWDRRSTFDWSQLWVVEIAGRPAAAVLCEDRFVPDENCGYVSDIGVIHDLRGRGLAKYLLHHAFATDTKAGRTGTILHVDSNNTTPALGLYTSVGMHPVMVIDVWRRSAPAQDGTAVLVT